MAQLLDRDGELSRLSELHAIVRRGDGRVAVISGAPGSGKSTLLDEFCARVTNDGSTVVRARCGEFEQELSLGVVRQLFTELVGSLDKETRTRVLAGAASRALGALGYDGAPITEAELFHALYWFSANLAAERPLVIAIDDAHFGDLISLRWVRYLTMRIEHVSVLVVMTTDGR